MSHKDVSYIVNYSNSNTQRTTRLKSFPLLKEARVFAMSQMNGYIIRHTDSECKLVEFFGKFKPSAQEQSQIDAIVDNISTVDNIANVTEG